jgi:hypothetical protein
VEFSVRPDGAPRTPGHGNVRRSGGVCAEPPGYWLTEGHRRSWWGSRAVRPRTRAARAWSGFAVPSLAPAAAVAGKWRRVPDS